MFDYSDFVDTLNKLLQYAFINGDVTPYVSKILTSIGVPNFSIKKYQVFVENSDNNSDKSCFVVPQIITK